MMGLPNNHWDFLLKMIILGCLGGTTISGNTHIYLDLHMMLDGDSPGHSR